MMWVTLAKDTERATESPGGGRQAARLYRGRARLQDLQVPSSLPGKQQPERGRAQ